MIHAPRDSFLLDYADPEPPADIMSSIHDKASRLRRRKRIVNGSIAAICSVAMIAIIVAVVQFPTARNSPQSAAGRTTTDISGQGFIGAPSQQLAVDQYVGALRNGDGSSMAKVLATGYSAQARQARIKATEGHPVTVIGVTLQETPSAEWHTVIIKTNDLGTTRTQKVLVGPSNGQDPEGPYRSWQIELEPPA